MQVWALGKGVLLPSACPPQACRCGTRGVAQSVGTLQPGTHPGPTQAVSLPRVSLGGQGLRTPHPLQHTHSHTLTQDEKSFLHKFFLLGWDRILPGAAAREASQGIELCSLSSVAPGFGGPRTAEACAGACTRRNAPPILLFPAGMDLAGPEGCGEEKWTSVGMQQGGPGLDCGPQRVSPKFSRPNKGLYSP